MICAGYPGAPEIPSLVVGNRDLISTVWTLPDSDGGSPVTGFLAWMKRSSDAEYTLVQTFGNEDPTYLSF